MNFIVKDNKKVTLFTGTKQDCMHFIKRRALKRSEFTLTTLNTEPALHYTVPVTAEDTPPKSFIKRIFSK